MADIQREDIITVELSAAGELTLEGEAVTTAELQQRVEQFAAVSPHRRVVALKVSPQATYDAYFQLQNTLVAAYRPLKCQPRVSELVEEGEKGGVAP